MPVDKKHARGGLVLLAALFLLVISPFAAEGNRPDEKATKKKMQGWSRDLGVKCSYCHVQNGRDFDYEADTAKKDIAAHCEEKFVKRMTIESRPVTCVDCHERHPQFFPRPAGAPGTPPATPPATPPGEGGGRSE